jgi:predicted nucleotidyltransferase
MKSLGYELLHKTVETAQYGSKDSDMGQVDFLFAHRTYALSMLERAQDNKLLGHAIRVVRPEDLIGLKIQSSSNDSNRAEKDMVDIHEVMLRHGKTMDWKLIEDYFKLFQRETEFQDLKKRFA